MWQPGDYLAVLQTAIGYLASKQTFAEKQQAAEVRSALKRLYFTDETIKRLEALSSLDALDELHYEAGRASIRQRDTRDSIAEAFHTLEKFGRENGVNIKAGRLIEGIMHSKKSVRREIEATYFAALRDGNNVQTAKIVSSIRELNRMIEELDDKLGGIILSEK